MAVLKVMLANVLKSLTKIEADIDKLQNSGNAADKIIAVHEYRIKAVEEDIKSQIDDCKSCIGKQPTSQHKAVR